GAVAGAVVGDQAVDVGDAVAGEEGPRAVDEPDRGAGFFIGQGFGVGQAGVAIDGGVQIGVAGPLAPSFAAGDLPGMLAVFAVDAPAAAVGNPAGLLHVQMDHVPRPAGDDLAWLPVGGASGVDEPPPVEAELQQVPSDGPHRDSDALGGEFGGDAASGVGPLAVWLLNPKDLLRRDCGRLVVRDAGPVEQACLAVSAPAVDPLAGALARDTHLRGDMGDRAGLTTLHEPATALDGQRGITVVHGRVFLLGR